MLNFMGAPLEQDLYQLAGTVANVAEHQHRHEAKRYSTEVKVFKHTFCRKYHDLCIFLISTEFSFYLKIF